MTSPNKGALSFAISVWERLLRPFASEFNPLKQDKNWLLYSEVGMKIIESDQRRIRNYDGTNTGWEKIKRMIWLSV